MCGIAGYFKQSNQDVSSYLNSAIVVLNKRGPDFATTKILDNLVGFAHARLSIIDTSAVAHQPMTDTSGRYTIVFNGEIFNYRELRQTYLQNVVFSSSSDTEVLLYLFIKFGKECLRLLNGFFAFAVYDNELKRMFLARDRYGIKPLVYYTDGNHFYFASELKALLQFDIKREIDFDALGLYLQLNYVPGTMSMLKGVSKLKPGHYLEFDQQIKLEEQTYYQVPFRAGQKIEAANLDYAAAKVQLRKLIEAAVERRLIADVPLGSFLSGGIDSSIVTACAVKHAANLNTFSIGFKDEPYFDETKYANLVAKKFKTNHTVFSISNDEMFSNIFSILDYTDEPFADSSAIAVYILSQKTRQKVTVALSGDGGDELFGGYTKYSYILNATNKFQLAPKSLRRGLAQVLDKIDPGKIPYFNKTYNFSTRYYKGISLLKSGSAQESLQGIAKFYTDHEIDMLFNKGVRSDGDNFLFTGLLPQYTDTLSALLCADYKTYMVDDILTKVDRASMSVSLEGREPLLDHRLVEFVAQLPSWLKIKNNNKKYLLKEICHQYIPKAIMERKKMGFGIPLVEWFDAEIKLYVDLYLSQEYIKQQGLFNLATVDGLVKRYQWNKSENVFKLWNLIMFQLWYEKWMN